MQIIETADFYKFISNREGYVVTNGLCFGTEIVAPKNSSIAFSAYFEVPGHLVPTPEYFAEHSEYDEGGVWDSIQDYGNQTDYSYAWANWSKSGLIIPKYPLADVKECMYALKDCRQLTDGRSLVFHITSDTPNMMYVCSNCNIMEYAPHFAYTAPIVKNYMSMYSGCMKLKDVFVYWGDGSTDPVAERVPCQNMFFQCSSLENVDFGLPETGSPTYLDLSYANNLKMFSVESLWKSLQSKFNTEQSENALSRSVHEITFSPNTLSMIKGTRTLLEDDTIVAFNTAKTGDVEYVEATEILPPLSAEENVVAISFDYAIVPENTQDSTQNFYAGFYLPMCGNTVVKAPENSLSGTIKINLAVSNGTIIKNDTFEGDIEDLDAITGIANYDLVQSLNSTPFTNLGRSANGLRAYAVNILGSYELHIMNFKYRYAGNEEQFTEKGWVVTSKDRNPPPQTQL